MRPLLPSRNNTHARGLCLLSEFRFSSFLFCQNVTLRRTMPWKRKDHFIRYNICNLDIHLLSRRKMKVNDYATGLGILKKPLVRTLRAKSSALLIAIRFCPRSSRHSIKHLQRATVLASKLACTSTTDPHRRYEGHCIPLTPAPHSSPST